ncbi:MAG TPA: SpoIIIAH-like family protein [Paenibacillus sp.]|uniref:SpoIIIAH-like family protein n=1 Tax=Paenibacillus sp. TaxID=58172 RepID=UPI0028D49878|nr:SpoIIIAH-like family protein [Paenibacillus sp.]HUC90857.1 SpoIIIAH-like family protein [Paenibacillus sp.]
MNTKRQTIWLVSMLSLMVVLSAYYLFTEDLDSGSGLDAETVQGSNRAADGTDAGNAGDPSAEQITVDEVADGAPSGDANLGGDGAAANGDAAKTDEEVLEQVASQGTTAVGGDTITRLQMGQLDALNKKMDELFGIISNTDNDPSQTTAAVAELGRLEEKKEKINDLEQQLLGSFPNAVVAEENDAYKVVVQSAKLERSQAAEIIDKVMKTMGVSADKVSVQFVP